MRFGKRIQTAMQQQNLGQSELAGQIGVSQSYISNLVSGRKAAPSQAVVRSLALALNIPVVELFDLAGLEPPAAGASFLLGVSGASGSGKTWFADKLQQLHPAGVTVISQDRYYRPQAEVALLPYTWDEPASLDLDELLVDLKKLKAGEPARIPNYDFVLHARTELELVQPTEIIVVEGHLIFHSPALLEILDESVWVQADDYQLLRRRLLRDCSERGRAWQEVLEVFDAVVLPASRRYVYPGRAKAAVELNNNQDNPEDIPLLAKSIVAYAKSL